MALIEGTHNIDRGVQYTHDVQDIRNSVAIVTNFMPGGVNGLGDVGNLAQNSGKADTTFAGGDLPLRSVTVQQLDAGKAIVTKRYQHSRTKVTTPGSNLLVMDTSSATFSVPWLDLKRNDDGIKGWKNLDDWKLNYDTHGEQAPSSAIYHRPVVYWKVDIPFVDTVSPIKRSISDAISTINDKAVTLQGKTFDKYTLMFAGAQVSSVIRAEAVFFEGTWSFAYRPGGWYKFVYTTKQKFYRMLMYNPKWSSASF